METLSIADKTILTQLTGDVIFKNVVFGYNEEKTILKRYQFICINQDKRLPL